MIFRSHSITDKSVIAPMVFRSHSITDKSVIQDLSTTFYWIFFQSFASSRFISPKLMSFSNLLGTYLFNLNIPETYFWLFRFLISQIHIIHSQYIWFTRLKFRLIPVPEIKRASKIETYYIKLKFKFDEFIFQKVEIATRILACETGITFRIYFIKRVISMSYITVVISM